MMARAMLAAAAVMLSSGAAAQGKADKSCDCGNLRSLQQEVENARYMEEFFRDLSGRLDAIEQRQLDLNTNHPTHPDSGRTVISVSAAARDQIRRTPANGGEFNLPHPVVENYTGPKEIDMKAGKCEQDPKVLKAMHAGSPCKEIAEISLRHENIHSAECKAAGADAYWARLPSAIAAEESERYAQQAREMLEQLKRVIDESELRLESTTSMQGTAPDFRGNWVMSTGQAVLEGKSSPGSASWKLRGRTSGTSSMTSATIAGMSCTTSGEFVDEVEYELETDGFKVSAKETTRSVSGQMSVKCGGGMGMSMRPSGEVGSGEIFAGQTFQPETVVEQDVAGMQFAQAIAGAGMQLTGTHKATLTCTPR